MKLYATLGNGRIVELDSDIDGSDPSALADGIEHSTPWIATSGGGIVAKTAIVAIDPEPPASQPPRGVVQRVVEAAIGYVDYVYPDPGSPVDTELRAAVKQLRDGDF